MLLRSTGVVVVLALSMTLMTGSRAEDDHRTAVGLRAGLWTINSEEDFEQYELVGAFALPWDWQWPSGWVLATALDVTAGTLQGEDDSAFIGSVGPSLVLSRAGGRFLVSLGVSPTYLSEHEFTDLDFGTALQLTSHLGIQVKVGGGIYTGYRLQHMSNADIEVDNPGLTLNMIEIGCRF